MRETSRWAALLVIVMTLGCGSRGPQVAEVTGLVTFDGKPVAAAGVIFTPEATGPSASGTTDANGRFRLATGSLDGAVLGPHRVAITKSESVGVAAGEGEVSGVLSRNWKLIQHLPPRYGRAETSGLTADVKEEDNDFTFSLTTQ